MVNYPAQIDNILSLPPAADGSTSVSASVVNRLRDAIIATQTELGIKPSSIYTTVRNRLDYLEGQINGLGGGGGAGIPGGLTTQVQFNDDGYFAGSSTFTFDKNTNIINLSTGIAIGGTTSTTGHIRLTSAGTIKSRDTGNTTDWNLLRASGGSTVILGDISYGSVTQVEGNNVDLYGSGSVRIINKNGSGYAMQLQQTTSDYLSLGATPATSGNLRLQQDFSIVARHELDTGDLGILTTFNGGDGYQELSLGTYNSGDPSESYDRISICANTLIYFWMDNTLSPFQIGKTSDGAYATFVSNNTNFAIVGSNPNVTQANSFGAGSGVFHFGPANTVPTTNPNVGIVAYVEGGVLKYRKTDGTIITLDGSGSSGFPGGNASEIQINDGVGGFAGATNIKAGTNYISIGPDPSTINDGIDLSNNQFIWSRNSGDNDNVSLIGVNGTDEVYIGDQGYNLVLDTGTGRVLTVSSDTVNFEFGLSNTKALQIIDGNIQIGPGAEDTGGGEGVIGIDNAGSIPSSDPTDGIILYSEDSTLKYRKEDGSVVSLEGSLNALVNIMDYWDAADGSPSLTTAGPGGTAITTKNIARAIGRALTAKIDTKEALGLFLPPAINYGVQAYSWGSDVLDQITWSVHSAGSNVDAFEFVASGEASKIILDSTLGPNQKWYIAAGGPAGMGGLFRFRNLFVCGDNTATDDCLTFIKTSVDLEVLFEDCTFYACQNSMQNEGVIHGDAMGITFRRCFWHGCTNSYAGGEGAPVTVGTGTFGALFDHCNWYTWERAINPFGGTNYSKTDLVASFDCRLLGGGNGLTSSVIKFLHCTWAQNARWGAVIADPTTLIIDTIFFDQCNIYGNNRKLLKAYANVRHTIAERTRFQHNTAGEASIDLEASTCERLTLRQNIATHSGIIFHANTGQTSVVIENCTGGTYDLTGALMVDIDEASTFDAITLPAVANRANVAHKDGIQIGTTVDFGGGEVVLGIDNATTNPTTNPTNGIIAYVDVADGYLKYRKADGAVITLDGSGGGGGGSPGGSTNEIQVNDGAGGFAGATNVTAGTDYIGIGSPNAGVQNGIDLANDMYIWGRNSTNNGSEQLLGLNTNDEVQLGNFYGLRLQTGGGRPAFFHSDIITFEHSNSNIQTAVFSDANLQFGPGLQDFGGGQGVIGIDNCSLIPSSNPTDGIILYVEGAALKYRQPDGRVVVVGDYGIANPDAPTTYSLLIETAGKMTLSTVTTEQTGNTDGKIIDVIRSIDTTDATVTDLYTWTILDDAVTTVDVVVTAVDNGVGAGGTWKRSYSFKSIGGTVTAIGSVHDAQTDEDSAGWDVTIDTNTGSGRVRVTGAASTNINWYGSVRVQSTKWIFTPQTASDCLAWYDALIDGTNVITSGATVLGLIDQGPSGDSNRVLVATSVSPSLVAADPTYGNRNVIEFTGTEWLETTTWSAAYTQPTRMYFVGHYDAFGSAYIFDSNDSSGTDRQAVLDGGAGALQIYAGVGTFVTGAVITVGTPFVACFIFNGASSEVYINDPATPVATGDPGSQSLVSLTLGTRYSHDSGFLDGKVAALGAFDGIGSTAERTQMFIGLKARYGIP